MAETLDNLYMKALKAVAKGHRSTSGGAKIRGEDRKVLKLYAKWLAEDPVFAAEVKRQKIPKPTPENLAKASYRNALKEMVRGYRQGWNRKKVAPEHRESILSAAKASSGKRKLGKYESGTGYTFLPRKVSSQLEAATRQRRKEAVALVDGQWYEVGNVLKGEGKPFLIGVGNGYSMIRFVVFARSEDDAYELAEQKWPKVFFNDITSKPPKDDALDVYYIESIGKWGTREQDIRMLKRVKEFHSNSVNVGNHLYRLKDGRVVEAR